MKPRAISNRLIELSFVKLEKKVHPIIDSLLDKLFRETWSNLENARSFLEHYLSERVVRLMDLESFEICKDSFVEKDTIIYRSVCS